MKTTRQKKVSLGPISELLNYNGCLCKASSSYLLQELALRFPYVCVIEDMGNKYELYKKGRSKQK